MKLVVSFALSAFVSVCSFNVLADAPAKAALCSACHGPSGNKPIMDAYPKIGGQNKAYIVSALKAYKDGGRKGGMAAVMAAQSKSLSDAEIEELANYFSAQ